MLNHYTHSKKTIQRAATEQKSSKPEKRLKLSPQGLDNKIWTQKLINFDQRKYPFSNLPIQTAHIYKTSVTVNSLLNESLRALAKINHPNIIAIRKILRSSVHSAPNQSFTGSYSLIYEAVPYELKYVGCNDQSVKDLSKKIALVDFAAILNSVSTFLQRQGVAKLIKLSEIGVTSEGLVKIYVPPQEILNSTQRAKDKQQVTKNNNKLISWWETTFASSQISGEESDKEQTKPHISQMAIKKCHSFTSSQKSMPKPAAHAPGDRKPTLQKSRQITSTNLLSTGLKSSCKSIQTDLSKISAMQREKMKQLNSQIKRIKDKLNHKQRKEKRKDSDNLIMESRLAGKGSGDAQHVFQSERLEKRNNPEQSHYQEQGIHRFRQSIQQNINCINIYNHASKESIEIKSPKESNRLTKTPVISYMIEPMKDLGLQPAHNSQRPNYVLQQHGPFFDSPFEDISDQQSLDTYDIELNANDLSQPIEQPRYRQTLTNLDRDISERNYKVKKNASKDQTGKQGPHQNKVQSRTFTTESAGPLQFKNFVNKYIKPQFLAKRSNIYEDPMEYDSQPSTQKPNLITEIANAGHSAISGTEKSRISDSQELLKLKDKGKTRQSQEPMPRILSDNRLTIFTTPQNSGLRSGSFLAKSPKFNLSRVQQIVEKSRRALNVLNRAKEGNSPLAVRKLSPLKTIRK